MKTELLLVIMAGVVLSLFVIVGEIAAMRKRVKQVRGHLQALYQAGSFLRLSLTLVAIAGFFLVQPVIIAALVALALNGMNPGFSGMVLDQLHHLF